MLWVCLNACQPNSLPIHSSINPLSIPKGDECEVALSASYHRFGYQVSPYYTFTSVKAFDLNADGVQDSLAILSPIDLLPEYFSCRNQLKNPIGNRLLLINLMNRQGKVDQAFYYDQVISNEPSSLIHPGEEALQFTAQTGGFILHQAYGQGCYAKYGVHIRYHAPAEDFVVDSLLFRTFCPGDGLPEKVESYPMGKDIYFLHMYHRENLKAFKQVHGIIP